MSDTIILLTACINPSGMAFTALQDKDVRLQQYREALDWYLKNVSNKIVFVENTCYDISPLYEDYIKSGRLEVLTFYGNDFSRNKGKGYGETLIIEYALQNSAFLSNSCQVIKVTGRYICPDINKILKKCKQINTIYAFLLKDKKGLECDSRVAVFPVPFLESTFLPRKDEINDSNHYYFEHLLYSASRQWIKKGYAFKEIWFPIDIQGVSGSVGTEYKKNTLKTKICFYIHYLLHRIGYYNPIRIWK